MVTQLSKRSHNQNGLFRIHKQITMERSKNKETMDRRLLLKGLGLGAATGALGMFGGINNAYSNTLDEKKGNVTLNQPADYKPMKIIKVESVRFNEKIKVGGGSGSDEEGAEFCWVRLHTDTGIIGTGETYPNINGELGALKDMAKRFLLGKDPRDINGIWQSIYQYSSMRNAGGSDMRILSAINMAQLDILGQSTGVPLYSLLGGKTRPRVKVYNTYTDGWLINDMKMGPDTAKIVRFLLDRGITGMKIYPFNQFSFMEGGRNAGGQFISSADIEKGLTWLKQIRETAGNKMEILLDAGGRWNLTSSQRILKAIEPYN